MLSLRLVPAAPRFSGAVTLSDSQKQQMVYGGFFNPPHLGHAHVLSSAAKALEADKITILVSDNGQKKSDREPFEHRFELTKLLAQYLNFKKSGNTTFEVCDVYKGKSNLWEALATLFPGLQQRPEKTPYLVGSDSSVLGKDSKALIDTFGNLENTKSFFQHFVLIILKRKEEEAPKLIQVQGETIDPDYVELDIPDIEGAPSSTQIRNAVKQQNLELLQRFLPQSIITKMEELGMYARSIQDVPKAA